MTTTINASTTAGLVNTADTSGVLALQTAGTTAVSISASQVVTLTNALAEASGGTGTTTGYYGFKNRIINGAMTIWQRATTQTFTNSLVYGSVDRWVFLQGGASASISQTQSTSVPTGFQYAIKQQRTAASTTTGTVYSVQEIETVNCLDLAGQAVTLSFWAKCGANFSASGSTLTSLIYQGTGTDEGTTSWISGTWTSPTSNTQSNTLTTSYQKFTQTVTLGASTTELVIALQWNPVGTAGADDSVFITGVQLEKGSTATSFDYRPYGTELALCQRYYAKFSSLSGVYVGFGSGVSTATTSASIVVKYPVRMRAAPTISQSNTGLYDGGGVNAVTSIGGSYYGDETLFTNINVASGLTLGRGCIWCGANNASAYIDLSSEL